MTVIDILILIVFIAGVIVGMVKGFIRQLASLLGLLVGLLAAKMLYATVADKVFSHVTSSPGFAQILAFIAIWVAVPLIFIVLAYLLTRALKAMSLGWINHWLGSGLGAIKFLLVASMVIGGIEFIDSNNALISAATKQQSLFYYPLQRFSGVFMPAAKAVTEQIINADLKWDDETPNL